MAKDLANLEKIDALIGALVVYRTTGGNGWGHLYVYQVVEAWVEAFGDDDLAGLQQRCADELLLTYGYDVKQNG